MIKDTLLEREMLESMVRQKRTASLDGRLLVARGLQITRLAVAQELTAVQENKMVRYWREVEADSENC